MDCMYGLCDMDHVIWSFMDFEHELRLNHFLKDHENKLARLHLMSRNIVLTLPNTFSHRQEGYTEAGIQVHEAFKVKYR